MAARAPALFEGCATTSLPRMGRLRRRADELDRHDDAESSLLIVQPATVLAWHRKGFQLYWR